ncbi:MAG: hypothetical protein KTR31_36125 [Myxococcales bacterium]|nr:hypothetical protein [Myxococcales bacterium]
MTCPISWFRLERYALGLLDGVECRDVAEHVTGCATCQARLGAIELDVRPMPPLRAEPGWRPLAWAAPLLLAALALLWLLPRQGSDPSIKGGDVSLILVRERAGAVTETPSSYAAGDRLQVRLTCPPGELQAVVSVTEGAAAPVEVAHERVTCGNAVPVGSALRLTGTESVEVCVTWDEGREQVCRSLLGQWP